MKRIAFIMIALLGFNFSLQAQSVRVANLYQKYRGEKGVVSIYLPGFVLKFAAWAGDLEGEERALVRSIRSMRVLTIEDDSRFRNVNFARELQLNRSRAKLVPLIEVHDGDQDVLILGKEKRGKLKDLLIVVGGEENVMVHIRGRMNADMIGSLADIADIDELRYTRQL